MTRTGNLTFQYPPNSRRAGLHTNIDGSVDIMYEDINGRLQGTRVFLSGATTQIDLSRRVIPDK
jgi:hypothetical protein